MWAKIDDRLWSHRKMIGISPGSLRTWLFGLAWSCQHETDGFVPTETLSLIKGSKRIARELVDAGLWEPDDKGWRIHDFSEYQPTRRQRNDERAATRERVRKHREKRRSNTVTTYGGNGVTDPLVTPCVRLSRPDPSRIDTDPTLRAKDLTGGSDPPPPDTPGGPVVDANALRETHHRARRALEASIPPERLEPDDETRSVADECGVDPAAQWLELRDHARAKGWTRLDWHAELRNWMRRSKTFRRGKRAQLRQEHWQPDSGLDPFAEVRRG